MDFGNITAFHHTNTPISDHYVSPFVSVSRWRMTGNKYLCLLMSRDERTLRRNGSNIASFPFVFGNGRDASLTPPPSLPLWKRGGGYDYVHTLVATDERHWKKGRLICNFVIGSRPLSRGNVSNWNGARLLLSVSVRLCLSFAVRLPVSFILFLVRFVLSISLSFCFMS